MRRWLLFPMIWVLACGEAPAVPPETEPAAESAEEPPPEEPQQQPDVHFSHLS